MLTQRWRRKGEGRCGRCGLTAKRERMYAPAPTPMPITLLTLQEGGGGGGLRRPRQMSNSSTLSLISYGSTRRAGVGHLLQLSHHRRKHFSQLVHGGVTVAADRGNRYVRQRSEHQVTAAPPHSTTRNLSLISGTHLLGKGGAPSCCPGASTCTTAKCCVISCMSS